MSRPFQHGQYGVLLRAEPQYTTYEGHYRELDHVGWVRAGGGEIFKVGHRSEIYKK
jgi:hypothetical protein